MEFKKNIKKIVFSEEKKINHSLIENTPRYRYIMEFPLGNIMHTWIVNCELPSPSVRLRDFSFGNYGIMRENNSLPIQVIFRDYIGDEINKNIFYKRIRDLFSDYNYNSLKINTTILRVNQNNDVINRWDLRGCFITALHHSNMYSETVEPELEITLHYDYCNLSYNDLD